MLRYVEFSPHPDLACSVECFWFLSGSTDGDARRIFPDACMDIIFNLSESSMPDPHRSFIVGNMTRPVDTFAVGIVDMLGVRFHPGGMSRFLRASFNEFTDQDIPLTALAPRVDTDLIYILKSQTTGERIQFLTRWLLLRRLPDMREAWRGYLRMLVHSKGIAPIRSFAKDSRLSLRQIERMFREKVGLTPKQLALTLRFREMRTLLDLRGTDLMQISTDLEFTDQAHMSKNFKTFAGMTPTAYLAARH